MKLLLLIVFLSLAIACVQGEGNITTTTAAPSPEHIITNGYTAADHEAPYIVFLFIHNEGSNRGSLCGGVIIHNNWVLTAAHCVGGDWVDIHYGTNKAWGGYTHKVAKSNVFKRSGFDIALIRTPHNDFNTRVNKVTLPEMLSYDNQMAKACGWGRMANGQVASQLQCAKLQIISTQECRKSFGFVNDDTTVCVSTPGGKSTCLGDSGGPLVTNGDSPILVGLTAWVDARGCMKGSPAGFSRVSFHLNWIRQISGVIA